MLTLGHGDPAKGYPLLLVAIFCAGIVQIVLSAFRMARFAAIFPAPVVEGMLCAIGLLIIVKQIPLLLGTKFEAHDFWPILTELPSHLSAIKDHPKVVGLGLFSLVLIFALGAIKTRWLKIVPPLVIVVAVGTIVGQLIGLDPAYMINVPHPFEHGIVLPHFEGVWNDHSLWLPICAVVLTLTMIDGVESMATIVAIDKIDVFKRKSDPNRTLLAMGVSNMASSFVGGLTIIPGGVKSTANIMGGGRTQWANFYNASFLLIGLFFARNIINLFPYPVLGAVLIFTGYKLCRPAVWYNVLKVGSEQLLVFVITALVTVWTDLLVGIIVGILAKLIINTSSVVSIQEMLHVNGSFLATAVNMFRNPIVNRESAGNEYHLTADRPLVCFNALQLSRELTHIPREATKVVLHIGNGVTLVDHTTCENLTNIIEESNCEGKITIEIDGWERLRKRSYYKNSMHTLDIEQAQIVGVE